MKKEENTITFYAAECGEFHEMGEYTKCNSLEEAYKKYRKYCKTSGNMCPAIEFSIHDPDSFYSDLEYPLPLSDVRTMPSVLIRNLKMQCSTAANWFSP